MRDYNSDSNDFKTEKFEYCPDHGWFMVGGRGEGKKTSNMNEEENGFVGHS